VYEVDKTVKVRSIPFSDIVFVSLLQPELFLERLEPSKVAHHDYILKGMGSGLLHRELCTAGTRVLILHCCGQNILHAMQMGCKTTNFACFHSNTANKGFCSM